MSNQPDIPQHVIDKYRCAAINDLDHPWFDDIYESTIATVLDKYPFLEAVDDIRFSGFGSQGDGASFEVRGSLTKNPWAGSVCRIDALETYIRGALTASPEVDALVGLIHSGSVMVDISTKRLEGSHYVHSNTVCITIDLYSDLDMYADTDDSTPFEHQVVMALWHRVLPDPQPWNAVAMSVLERLEQVLTRDLRREMNTLWYMLGDRYDELTSDEAIAEYIVDNGLWEGES